MKEFSQVYKQLLKSEYDAAKTLFEQTRAAGYSAVAGAAIIYKRGIKAGKDAMRDNLNRAYKKLHDYQKAHEAELAAVADVEAAEDYQVKEFENGRITHKQGLDMSGFENLLTDSPPEAQEVEETTLEEGSTK